MSEGIPTSKVEAVHHLGGEPHGQAPVPKDGLGIYIGHVASPKLQNRQAFREAVLLEPTNKGKSQLKKRVLNTAGTAAEQMFPKVHAAMASLEARKTRVNDDVRSGTQLHMGCSAQALRGARETGNQGSVPSISAHSFGVLIFRLPANLGNHSQIVQEGKAVNLVANNRRTHQIP